VQVVTSFLEQIAAFASPVALRCGESTLSYAALHQRSARLAVRLRAMGVGAGTSVAICMDRSFDAIVAALATMRAGAAYVPLDPAWPEERLAYIVNDSGALVLIAPEELSSRVGSSAVLIDLSKDAEEPGTALTAPGLGSTPAAEDLAYIIYTSGSTGTPKGVEITHKNLNHLIQWHTKAFDVTSADRASHMAGLGFDAAVWEIWPYLAAGASISLVDETTRTSPSLLQRWLIEEGISIAFVPTPIAEPMMRMTWPDELALRCLLTGGDTLHAAPATRLPFSLVNNYGPTECTVVATSGEVAPLSAGLPSIGRAIEGASVYILDERQHPVADGETGEIYIGGDGVGRGYRAMALQTAKSFMDDPFTPVAGGRMYKTGDMGRWLGDGQIAFLGRQDGQAKIRGNRLELDEVAAVLNRHQDVTFSVVVTSDGGGSEKHLVGYVLLADGALPSVRELQDFARKSLPGYMIPFRFVKLMALPLSANGKVDRSLLPMPSEENDLPEEASREANSEVEETLLAMVRSLLETERVRVEDDFFLIGGHSLLGTQLALRVRERFGVKMTLRDLFEASTVVQLAERVEALIMEQLDAMSEEDALRLVGDERHG
jgi:amino acid adenylation domain-containing protein